MTASVVSIRSRLPRCTVADILAMANTVIPEFRTDTKVFKNVPVDSGVTVRFDPNFGVPVDCPLCDDEDAVSEARVLWGDEVACCATCAMRRIDRALEEQGRVLVEVAVPGPIPAQRAAA